MLSNPTTRALLCPEGRSTQCPSPPLSSSQLLHDQRLFLTLFLSYRCVMRLALEKKMGAECASLQEAVHAINIGLYFISQVG